MQVALWLGLGTLLGAAFSTAAHTFRWGAKAILGYSLMFAAIVYLPTLIFYGISGHSSALRMVVAPTGVVLYWWIAFLGMRGSSWWLVAGWSTRPVWNLALHHIGPSATAVPTWFSIFCAGFDVMIAATIVVYEDISRS